MMGVPPSRLSESVIDSYHRQVEVQTGETSGDGVRYSLLHTLVLYDYRYSVHRRFRGGVAHD